MLLRVIDSFSSLVHLQHLDVLAAKPSSAAGNEDPGVKLYRSGGLSIIPCIPHVPHYLLRGGYGGVVLGTNGVVVFAASVCY
jgi:hypothetical protein